MQGQSIQAEGIVVISEERMQKILLAAGCELDTSELVRQHHFRRKHRGI